MREFIRRHKPIAAAIGAAFLVFFATAIYNGIAKQVGDLLILRALSVFGLTPGGVMSFVATHATALCMAAMATALAVGAGIGIGTAWHKARSGYSRNAAEIGRILATD